MTKQEIENMAIDYRNPASILMDFEDNLSPSSATNDYREAARIFLRIMNLAVTFISSSKSPRNAALAVGYTLKVFSIDQKSQRKTAKELGLSSGTISAYVVKFRKELEPITKQ